MSSAAPEKSTSDSLPWTNQLALINKNQPSDIQILHHVLSTFGINMRALDVSKRHPEMVTQRWRVWFELRRRGFSYPGIARLCGVPCHSTIISGVQRHMKRLGPEPETVTPNPVPNPYPLEPLDD